MCFNSIFIILIKSLIKNDEGIYRINREKAIILSLLRESRRDRAHIIVDLDNLRYDLY